MDFMEQNEVICCGLCKRSMGSRSDLYEHFQNHHGINQDFRANRTERKRIKLDTIEKKQINERPPSAQNEHHSDKQINDMRETPHTVAYPTSKYPDGLASSSVISSTESSAIFSNPTGTVHYYPKSADLIAGTTLPRQSEPQFHRPWRPFDTDSVEDKENLRMDCHTGNITEERHLANFPPSEFLDFRDQITIVNNPTNTI